MNRFFFLCIGIVFMYSCKTEKETAGGKIKPLTAEQLDAKVQQNKLQFNTFSGKTNTTIASPIINQDVAVQIDMEKNIFIGISVRKLGIEVLKANITPDSVKILDRLGQKYYPHSFNYIQNTLNLAVSFEDLQNLIIGNPIFYDSTTLIPGFAEDKYILYAQNSVYKNTLWLSPAFTMMRMFIENLQDRRTISCDYSNFDKINEQQFAFMRKILIDAQSDISILMEFTKVSINEPLNYTFTVNPKYEKIE